MNTTTEADLSSKTEWHPLIASDRVEGTAVYDRDGEKIGTVRNSDPARSAAGR